MKKMIDKQDISIGALPMGYGVFIENELISSFNEGFIYAIDAFNAACAFASSCVGGIHLGKGIIMMPAPKEERLLYPAPVIKGNFNDLFAQLNRLPREKVLIWSMEPFFFITQSRTVPGVIELWKLED